MSVGKMRIERRSYSRSPWRLITADGREVSAHQAMDHPSLRMTLVNVTISGDTKAECTERALALLQALLDARTKDAP